MAELTKRQMRQQQTREALLDAAERCFAERGFDAVTVPQIAAEAGFTTGAVYSNFSGKAELFLELIDRAMGQQATRRAAAVSEALTPGDQLRQVARLWIDLVRERPELIALTLEFWSYSRRDPDVRIDLGRRMGMTRAGMAALIHHTTPEIPEGLDVDRVASATYAMAHGLALHHILDPEAVPMEVLEDAIVWLFHGAGLAT